MKKTLFALLIVTLFFTGCKKDSVLTVKKGSVLTVKKDSVLTVEKDSFVLFHNETAKIEASTTSQNKITYSSSDKYVAKVDDEGVITAGVIGDAEITVSDEINTIICKVKVKPVYTNFELAPKVEIGATKAELLSKLEGLNFTDIKNTITYIHEKGDPEKVYIQTYTIKEGKVDMIGVFFQFDVSTYTNTYAKYISERYIPIGMLGSNKYSYTSKEKDVLVIFDLATTIYTTIISYTKVDPNDKSLNAQEDQEEIMNLARKTLDIK